jgi:hypothetical protein
MAFGELSLKPMNINYKLVDLFNFIDNFQQFTVMVRIRSVKLAQLTFSRNLTKPYIT